MDKMSKNSVIIALGSPRKNGNSALLAQKTAEGIKTAGAQYESLFLHDMNINPCRACDSCQEEDAKYCIIEDDMQGLYPKLQDAEAIVIASPIYWFTVSAQMKLFVDRWYPFERPDGNLLAGKRVGVLLVYGDTDPYTSGAVNAIRTFQDACSYIGANLVGIVYGSAMDAGDIAQNKEVMEKAFRLGKQLVSE
jgi:multimeric flavodoxin WrbA